MNGEDPSQKEKRRRQKAAPLEEGSVSAHRAPADALRLHRFLLVVLDRVVEPGPLLQEGRSDETDQAADKDVDADHVGVLGGKRRDHLPRSDEQKSRPDPESDAWSRTAGDDRGE